MPSNESQLWEEKVYAGDTPIVRGPEVARWTTKGYFIRRFLRPTLKDNVLDVGCGLGEFSLLTALDAKQVLGVDASPTAIAAAQCAAERLGFDNVEFTVGDAYKLVEAAGDRAPFDLALCFDLLEHTTRPGEVLRGMYDLLRPGGRALVYTNCFGRFSWPYLKEKRRTGGNVGPLWQADLQDHHFVRFTTAQLDELTQGWRAVRIYKHHFLVPAASWLSGRLDAAWQAAKTEKPGPALKDLSVEKPACRVQQSMRLPRKMVQAAKLAVSAAEMETLGRFAPAAGVYLLLEKP